MAAINLCPRFAPFIGALTWAHAKIPRANSGNKPVTAGLHVGIRQDNSASAPALAGTS